MRSSSYTAWDICPHKYLLSYVLGIKDVSGISADMGNVTHKALELLARYKLATQNNKAYFNDDELGEFNVNDIHPESAIEIAYHHIKGKTPHHTWTDQNFADCKKYMYEALNFRNGLFSPLKRDIVQPEQYFEFKIEKPWAEYDYTLPNGEKISGHLGIKGTMDLMVKQGEDYEMIDWKTGAMMDWGKMQAKTYDSLMSDPQLRLYHYAATKLYPDIKNIFVTIFYVKAGGPHSMYFGPKDIEATEQMLKKRFDIIRNTVRPPLVYPSRKCSFCHFKKYKLDGSPASDYDESICSEVRKDVVELGLDRVMVKYGQSNAFNNYGSGGGRSEQTTKGTK